MKLNVDLQNIVEYECSKFLLGCAYFYVQQPRTWDSQFKSGIQVTYKLFMTLTMSNEECNNFPCLTYVFLIKEHKLHHIFQCRL